MKIIFLDIDGVLNHQLWFENWLNYKKENNITERDERRWFDPRCIDLLNSITDETDAKIVVSSSWRRGKSIKDLQNLLKSVGVTGDVISKTPRLTFEGLEDYTYSVPRGCEIKAWLETNKDILSVKMSKVKYVILDDDSDMLYWQRENYIWVDRYCGLTSEIAKKAKILLKHKL